MAHCIDSRHAALAFMSEPGLQNRSRTHTPPYTPARNRLPLDGRAPSPASSIHPTETTSPAKKSTLSHSADEVLDTVGVEELTEVEFAYIEGAELVYPDGFEEYDDGEARDEVEANDLSESDVEGSDSAMAHKLSQLYCEDPAGEAEMRKIRRRRRLSKRFGSRTFKRSHSQSIKSESEATDSDAMDDHDLMKSARRLRRKVSVSEKYTAELKDEEARPQSRDIAVPSSFSDRPIPFPINLQYHRAATLHFGEEEEIEGYPAIQTRYSVEIMDLNE